MSSLASSLAQQLAPHPDDDVLQALSLLVSLRPDLTSGLANLAQEEPAPRYTGRIATFTPEKCFGFIESEAAMAHYGKDVFLSDKEIGSCRKGDQVSFTVVINKDGHPQARLLFAEVTDRQPTLVAPPPPPPARMQSQSQWMQPASFAGWDTQFGNDEARYTGRIAAFNPERRYGFIESEAVHQMYGKDTFLSDQEIGQCNIGDAVTFAVAINKDGRPQARNVQPFPGGKRAFQDNALTSLPPPPQKIMRTQTNSGDDGYDGDRFVGVINTFFPEKHFGFIKSEKATKVFGKDPFLSDQEIGSFSIGSTVSFRVELNRQGKPQARDLQASGGQFGGDFAEVGMSQACQGDFGGNFFISR